MLCQPEEPAGHSRVKGMAIRSAFTSDHSLVLEPSKEPQVLLQWFPEDAENAHVMSEVCMPALSRRLENSQQQEDRLYAEVASG